VVYVEPTNVAEIRAAVDRLLVSEEDRTALGDRGRRRAAQFSWDRTAAATLSSLEELIGATR
jgi:glycosyltransferase involved in cell wall biosynthesis